VSARSQTFPRYSSPRDGSLRGKFLVALETSATYSPAGAR
jgi:hypothetical protein